MPNYIRIDEVLLDLSAVSDAEDAAYALEASPTAGDDDHTARTLGECLEALGASVPAVRAFAAYTDEERYRGALALEGGRVLEVSREERPKRTGPEPARTRSTAYATFERAQAEVGAALDADDGDRMLRVLDDPGLGEQLEERHPGFRAGIVSHTRAGLWRAFERRRREGLTFERVLRALEEEDDRVVEAVVYRLFVFDHLARPLFEAHAAAEGRLRERLARAIDAWPDFPFATAKTVALPRAESNDLPPGPERLIKQLDAVLPSLRAPKLHGFRKLLRELGRRGIDEATFEEVRAHAMRELLALARATEPDRPRAFALEILLALGVPAVEVVPLSEGLPDSPGLRALRADALWALCAPVRESHETTLGRADTEWTVADRTLVAVTSGVERLRVTVPFAPTVGLLDRGARGVLAWDGRSLFGAPLESGLLVTDDGATEELLPPLLLASIDPERERHALEAERSAIPVAPSGDGVPIVWHPSEVPNVISERAEDAAAIEVEWRALREAQAELVRAIEAGATPEAALGFLLDARVWPTFRPVKRIARERRLSANDAIARGAGEVPLEALVSLIGREHDEEDAGRIARAWRWRAQHLPELGERYRLCSSAMLRRRLRELLGHVADRYDREGVIERALARAGAAVPPPSADHAVIESAITSALAVPSLAEPSNAKSRVSKAERAALSEAEAIAEEATRSDDPSRILAALDSAALTNPRAYPTRRWLWSTLLDRPRKSLAFERVIVALQVEPSEVAGVIAYKLYRQKDLADAVGEALVVASRLGEPGSRLAARLASVIDEWPDHPRRAHLAIPK